MKVTGMIAIIVLAISLALETFFLVKQVMDRQELVQQTAELQQNLKDEQNHNQDALSKNESLTQDLKKVTAEKETQSQKADQLEKDVDDLNQQISALKKNVSDQKSQISSLKLDKSALTTKYMCRTDLTDIDFSSNDSVNQSLKQYVEDTKNRDEPVSASYWNLIWTGEKYSIHTVEVYSEKDRMNYVWKFTVYFRGEAYGDHENGVFYNDAQCWMYLDK